MCVLTSLTNLGRGPPGEGLLEIVMMMMMMMAIDADGQMKFLAFLF